MVFSNQSCHHRYVRFHNVYKRIRRVRVRVIRLATFCKKQKQLIGLASPEPRGANKQCVISFGMKSNKVDALEIL